jgi:hypothetical protein
MARKKKSVSASAQFVQVFGWEMDLPAWRFMSCYGRCLLIELRRLYNGGNNGRIGLSVRQAAELLGCNKNTAQRIFKELVEKGWIAPSVKGAFEWKARHATTWRLTDKAVAFGIDQPTKEYARWQPVQKPVPASGTIGLPERDRGRRDGITERDREDDAPRICPAEGDRALCQRSEPVGHSVSAMETAPRADASSHTEPFKLTAATVRDERLRQGLSLRDFGVRVGLSHTYIGLIEKGARPISAAVATKLSSAFSNSNGELHEG